MNNKEKYVIESMGMGLRTDCFLRNAYIKRHDEDGDTWSISYDFLELAIEYDTVEEALAMAEQLYEVAPGDDVEVVTLKQAKETVSLLNDIGRRFASVSKSLSEDSRNLSLGFEDEEDNKLAYQKFIDSLSEVKEDVVNHPAHYENDKYQCIDVMEDIYGTEAVMHFCMCNAFKYIWRFQKKNGIEDIQKAQWYMNKYQELGKNLTKETERC
jgi:hypothetical protein